MTDHPHSVQRELSVKGREGREVTVVVRVYRNQVWLSVTPPFESDIAILYPPTVDRLMEILTWAAHQARRYPGDGM